MIEKKKKNISKNTPTRFASLEKKLLSPEEIKDTKVKQKIESFFREFDPLEIQGGNKLLSHYDQRSKAFYITCHLVAGTLVKKSDLDASIDSEEEDEIYKLNREITEDQVAYRMMEEDAAAGRSFEDMVVEYDKSYRPDKPLKIYGGQHRIKAITSALLDNKNIYHGVRIYFNLSKDQKVEIATINNTSIAVPNDLLDRMREQLLGSELRDWCQKVGLLGKGKDFADRRKPDIPTVRIARTLIVNYYKGMKAKDDELHQPIICKSGGLDEDYIGIRPDIKWDDTNLNKMGSEYAKLHNTQRTRVLSRDKDRVAEFARKALSLSVVASWGYAAGYFQRKKDFIGNLYSLPDLVREPDDPLNAKALSQARLKGTDPDTYRGLGTRSSSTELGRMLEVFIVLASKAQNKTITKKLANAAIQSYEAKKAQHAANQAIGKI